MKKNYPLSSPVTIEVGPADWQVLQQDDNGAASFSMSGGWWTIIKRRKPQVYVRIVKEGGNSAIGRRYDWARAVTVVDKSVKGPAAGKIGTWKLTLKNVPCGGPYRIDTCVGSAEDAIEWMRTGEAVHFLCVGDVWLIAGQSNAEGYGRDPVDDPSEIGVHMFGERGRWEIAANGKNHSPWLAFGKNLRKELGYPVGLIPTAVGGSSMSQWDPGKKGVLYDAMKKRVNGSGCQASPGSFAVASGLRGIFWYQGESDANAADFPKYKVKFARFLNGVRRISGRPGLPVITIQLNRMLSGENPGGWEAMREIQRELSHEIRGVFVVSVFESMLCDGIHNSSQGNLIIARRAADAALGGVYAKDVSFLHPECVSARQASRNIINLVFRNVNQRLDYCGKIGSEFAFAVRDAGGNVPIAGFKIMGKNVFRIILGRAATGRTAVTGVPGSAAPHVVPCDIEGRRSMLAFTMDVDLKR